MRTSESIAKVSAAFVAAQAELGHAPKKATNPHFKSKYADLATIIDTIRPVLAAHRLAVIQRSMEAQGGVRTQTVLLHESGEWIADDGLFVPAGKQDAQGFGSAHTYSRRFGAAGLLGLAQDDDDGNAAVASKPKQQAQPVSNVPEATLAALRKRVAGLPEAKVAELRSWMSQQGIDGKSMTAEQAARLDDAIALAEHEAAEAVA